MVNRIEANFVEFGKRLKAIRTELRMTLDDMSKDTGMSRSYISDFERGFRRPTSKFMHYLHDRHNVNLNYIFSDNVWMFRTPSQDTPPDFSGLQKEVNDMLSLMDEIPNALFSVLAYFSDYKLKSKHIIEMYRAEKKAETAE